MTKPIPMTIEGFFKTLKKTKQFGPKLQKGRIRYADNRGCPLSASYKVLTGVHRASMDPDKLRARLSFRADRRRPFNQDAINLIVEAADDISYAGHEKFVTRLRRRMLRTLGLREKK